MSKCRFLSGNMLKIIAAISMLTDHFGLMFFPFDVEYRIIGRLAFPIFAFMISEGAKYTKNRIRYFFSIFLLGVICQSVYNSFDYGAIYNNILLTFSVSILLIYLLDLFKGAMLSRNPEPKRTALFGVLFILAVVAVYVLNNLPVKMRFDYGFAGCMIPVMISAFDFHGLSAPDILLKLDCLPVRLIMLALGLLMFIPDSPSYQWYALLALIPLALYSGKRGKYNMKYFFYIFYPTHLVLLEGLYILLR